MKRGYKLHVAAVLCLSAAATQSGLSSRAPSARDLADRAAAYVRELDEQLVSIVGRERHEQHSIETTSASTHEERRVLDALIAWVHMPALNDTLAVREVMSIDGDPAAPASRLEALLKKPAHALSAAVRQLLDESAAYNLAPGTRNINFPTFALAYLRPENVGRSRWKLVRREGALTVLSFEERKRPALVRSVAGEPLWGRGSIWIDAKTGRIERTVVRLGRADTLPADGAGERATKVEMNYLQEVTFAHVDRLDIWLPRRMSDVYEGVRDASRLRVEGVAVYSDYRRFETEGRLLPND